jgi:hypothetical protein
MEMLRRNASSKDLLQRSSMHGNDTITELSLGQCQVHGLENACLRITDLCPVWDPSLV